MHATQPGWYTDPVAVERSAAACQHADALGHAAVMESRRPASLQRLFATHRPVVGGIRPAPAGPEHVFAIRVPILRGNAVKYALSAIVNVESLARMVPRQLANSGEWTRSSLDSEGTIAVRTRGARGLRRRKGERAVSQSARSSIRKA